MMIVQMLSKTVKGKRNIGRGRGVRAVWLHKICSLHFNENFLKIVKKKNSRIQGGSRKMRKAYVTTTLKQQVSELLEFERDLRRPQW